MAELPPLPKSKVIAGVAWPICPWCAADCSAATLTLGGLWDAHEAGELERPSRPAGAAGEGTLTCECPACAKPFMVGLQRERFPGEPVASPFMRLLPVRTAADLRYEAGDHG